MAPTETAPSAMPARNRPRWPWSAKRHPSRRHERLRVDRVLVDPHLEVRMAARGGPGGADRGDVLPRRHVLTDVDEDATRAVVRVAGGDAAAVVDLDEVAVGPEPTCIDHRAGMCRVDGAAAGRPDVGAPVVRVRAGGAVRP